MLHPRRESQKELNLSMPTVLANVNDLLEKRGVGRNWGICFNRWKKGKKKV